MKTLEIKKSWFYTAGRKWGWEGQGFDTRGIGINKDILFSCAKSNEGLKIRVDGKEYLVDPQAAIDFIKARKSFYKMPGGTMIGVVSKSLCTPILPEVQIEKSHKVQQQELQLPLI